MSGQIPTRFTGATPQAISDLYDKINNLESRINSAAPSPSTTVNTTTTVIRATEIGGATGQAAVPQFAMVPVLAALPSNNPTQGAPYAQNGLVILFNDQLWQYTGAPAYQWSQIATGTVLLSDTHANRVANFPATTFPDALFVETDTLILLWSTGGIWTTLAGAIEDTHAHRLTNWPSVQFSEGTQFFETDRTVMYIAEDSTGTVTVSGGTNVAWASGNHFINTGTGFNATQWPTGTPIVINGVAASISAVASDIALTLQVAVANGTFPYSVASGRWVYQSGQYAAALASLPSDLGENETVLASSNVALGFTFFENAAYHHQLQWNVSAWQRGPADRDHSDTFVMFGVAPTDPGWNICDGSSVNYLKYDGTTASRTLPNIAGSGAYPKAETAYAAGITGATAPTVTPTGTISATFTGSPSGSVAVQAGVGTNVAPPFTPAGSIAGTFTGGSDTTSLAGGDPVASFGVLLYYRQ